jgi:hypothetical protein
MAVNTSNHSTRRLSQDREFEASQVYIVRPHFTEKGRREESRKEA